MKDIYDEAIKELNHELSVGNIGIITRDNIATALERAEKEHELLGLYRYLNENTNDYDLHPDEVDETHNKIYELEEELKWERLNLEGKRF